MSLQDEFHAAGQEYARQLDKNREELRLSTLRLEAQHHSNASAFAEAFERALAAHADHPTDSHTEENNS